MWKRVPRNEDQPIKIRAFAVFNNLNTVVRGCTEALDERAPVLEYILTYSILPALHIYVLAPAGSESIKLIGAIRANIVVKVPLEVHRAYMN